MKLIKTTKNGLTYYEAIFKSYSIYTFTMNDMIKELAEHENVMVWQFFKFNLN